MQEKLLWLQVPRSVFVVLDRKRIVTQFSRHGNRRSREDTSVGFKSLVDVVVVVTATTTTPKIRTRAPFPTTLRWLPPPGFVLDDPSHPRLFHGLVDRGGRQILTAFIGRLVVAGVEFFHLGR